MSKSSNQKLKLIYLMKILLERTDETIMGVLEHNEVTELRFADNEQEENMHVVENIKDMVG